MAKYKIVLVDTDVISHFIATGNISQLAKIFKPNILCVLDEVYKEACRHPWDPDRKKKVDASISLYHARFPVSTMKDYAPDRDLSWWY